MCVCTATISPSPPPPPPMSSTGREGGRGGGDPVWLPSSFRFRSLRCYLLSTHITVHHITRYAATEWKSDKRKESIIGSREPVWWSTRVHASSSPHQHPLPPSSFFEREHAERRCDDACIPALACALKRERARDGEMERMLENCRERDLARVRDVCVCVCAHLSYIT